MNILVGDSGLVGKTLKENLYFNYSFNSKNIEELKYINNDSNITIYLSCLPATKWLVNNNLKKDIDNINSIIYNLSYIKYKKIILISTIDVYCDSPLFSDESSSINVNNLSYGINRYFFELLVKNNLEYEDLKIFRLPALFNKNIKKNILFDLLTNNNVSNINKNSKFQWYNLDNLIKDINFFINKFPEESLFNLFTEPLDTYEIIKLFPEHENKIIESNDKIEYNYKTKYDISGYIKNRFEILEDIKIFVNEFSCK